MKEILETIIRNLVSDTDAVSINEVQGDKTIVYEVRVAEKDMGKVIGRDGKVARSIRTIMKSVAAKEEKRVSVEFLD